MKKSKDYRDYGYKDESILKISGKTMNSIMLFVDTVMKYEGIKVGFEQMEDEVEMLDTAKNPPKEFLTPIGHAGVSVMSLLELDHIKNVDEGNAVHKDELSKFKPVAQA